MYLKRGEPKVALVYQHSVALGSKFATCLGFRATLPRAEALAELCDAFNTLTLLVSGHLSPRKVLPDSTRTPGAVMAVTWRRKNIASSCRNTQNAAIMASLPNTGTQNYRRLRMDSWVSLLPAPQSSVPTEPWDGSSQ